MFVVFMHSTQFARLCTPHASYVIFSTSASGNSFYLYLYSPDTEIVQLFAMPASKVPLSQDFFPLTLLARFKYARYNGRANTQGWLQPFQTKWPRAIRHRLFQKSFQIDFFHAKNSSR